ncbi:MAG TPA: three-Cys-motif partner protein TcmP [Solirubrobacterales bacterium]
MATLSNYGPHTDAKHRILRRYLEAWLPIMGMAPGPTDQRGPALVVVDGFSGAGRYDTGEQGSPLIMLDAYLEHRSRARIRQRIHFFFIEKEKKFISNLEEEVGRKPLEDSNADVEFRHGLFAEQFPDVIRQMKGRYARMPATFAFIDPFGLKDNSLELTSGLAVQQRCEVLVYLPNGFMARFESTDEFAPALDHLYGSRDAWVYAKEIKHIEERRAWMRDRFGEVLSAQTTGSCLAFDIRGDQVTANAQQTWRLSQWDDSEVREVASAEASGSASRSIRDHRESGHPTCWYGHPTA